MPLCLCLRLYLHGNRWVPATDTFHSLIRDYRHERRIPLNLENREMLKIAPEYDMLTVMQKVEVFTEALRRTTGKGNDMYEILWLKSTNSEEWLERRTNFTRSLAVMSMVGYILGLGDRHPSNLMLDKLSGRVLHIDFGDCFEVAMNRDKYPEKVPFRLTRMLIKAMEVSGIEGSYRSTCERTMAVLRDNRDSLVAMLEAFVYDPLISWRLADLSQAAAPGDGTAQQRPSARNSLLDNVSTTARGSNMPQPISEHPDEENMDENGPVAEINPEVAAQVRGMSSQPSQHQTEQTQVLGQGQSQVQVQQSAMSTQDSARSASSRARSLQMYNDIQNWAANLHSSNSRIAHVSAGGTGAQGALMAADGSIARSRIERSMRQREALSLLGGDQAAAQEEALNEKALKVVRRVQDKLTGTDFADCEERPLDVPDQVQRLIVQATSSENLCQLFIGWCAFW
jgi:phosphatidylinositol kinase/protein kinase (PI-3  family)